MDTLLLRPVRPDELDLLTEINDDACLAYQEYGLSFDLREDHPLVLAEAARWKAAVRAPAVRPSRSVAPSSMRRETCARQDPRSTS